MSETGTAGIRVVVADDQTVVREGLVLMLDLMDGVTVVGTAADGNDAVDVVTQQAPDVVLMDLNMPRCTGVEATGRIVERLPDVAIVVLTTYADDESVLGALRAGARGYLTKDASAEEIERAVRQAAAGRVQLDPAVQARLVELVAREPRVGTAVSGKPVAGLTERETEVLRLIADGLGNREIASRLFVSEATVKTHVNNLFGKLGVSDRSQAVAYAFRSGLAG